MTTEAPEVPEIDAQTVSSWMSEGSVLLVDVRETSEYEFEHVSGALLHPLSFLDTDTFPVITEKKVVLMCRSGKRSLAAAKQLTKAGYPAVLNLTGGLKAWGEAGLDTEGARFETEDFSI
jgi:rhodanese-related sulfurtransferase